MIHKFSEKMHAMALASLFVGAFAVTSALAGPIESRTFAGGCVGGYYCGGFQSYLRGVFPQPVLLNSVQFTVSSNPVNGYSRVYVDIYSNGQRVAQGVDVTGWNQFRNVSLPPIQAWDLVIVPATYDSIQVGNVTVLYEEFAPGPGPGPSPGPSPFPSPSPGPGNPNAPGNSLSELLHCGSPSAQTTQCVSSFVQIANVQLAPSSTGPGNLCQYGYNWGVSGNSIWVNNGCEADFVIQGYHY